MKRTIAIRMMLGLMGMALFVTAAGVPTAGTTAPGFTLPSQEGKQVNLKDFAGKWVVLYFYPKDFTQGCTIEAHNFQEDQAQYTKLNAAIVGVSVDSVNSHTEFCTKENLTFKLLADEKHAVVSQYGSVQKFGDSEVAARNTFIIDPKGVIRKVFEKVNPTPHSKEVLASLAELQK
jgi:peroxiredoxin Q/BCP